MFSRLISAMLFAGLVTSAAAQNNQTVPDNGFCTKAVPGGERPVSWKKLVPNLLCDQVPIWTFPLHVVQGHNLIPSMGFVGVTTGLVLLDPSDAPYFRRTNTFHTFNQVLSGNNAELATILVPWASTESPCCVTIPTTKTRPY